MTSRDSFGQSCENFIEDMRDIINPSEGIDTGNDDFIFGSYVEWPNLDEIDEETLEQLLDYFDIEIPFGKSVEVCSFFLNFFKEKIGATLDIPIENPTYIRFPELSQIKDFTINILRERNVPEGIIYEADMSEEYPEHMKYWVSDPEENWDYEFYISNPLDLTEYRNGITAIKEDYESATSDSTKCALILSALVHAEYYAKATILQLFEQKRTALSSIIDINQFEKVFLQDIYKANKIRDAYALFTGLKLKTIPFRGLRNSLAHSIAESKIERCSSGDQITYKDKKGNRKKCSFLNFLLNYTLTIAKRKCSKAFLL